MGSSQIYWSPFKLQVSVVQGQGQTDGRPVFLGSDTRRVRVARRKHERTPNFACCSRVVPATLIIDPNSGYKGHSVLLSG